MRELRLTSEQLCRIVNNYEKIGRGSYGKVIKLTDNYLFKLNYQVFFRYFQFGNNCNSVLVNPNIRILKQTYPNSIVENVKNIIDKQKNINLTKLPVGLVFVDDFCVGYILKYHKNMLNLEKYLNEYEKSINRKDINQIITNLKESVNELLQNSIYQFDIGLKNILVNPKTKEVQMIDFEDEYTESYASRNSNFESKINYRLKSLVDDMGLRIDLASIQM
ncbi:MAG: hypothetical protein PHS54_03070 [Clostridia bacterium]|nr:hypothetical protein [Clostridia bacterium]